MRGGGGSAASFQNILAKHICCVFSCHSNVSNCLLLKNTACDDIQVDGESHCVCVRVCACIWLWWQDGTMYTPPALGRQLCIVMYSSDIFSCCLQG